MSLSLAAFYSVDFHASALPLWIVCLIFFVALSVAATIIGIVLFLAKRTK